MKRSQREAAMRGSSHLLRLSLPAVRSNGAFEGADVLAESGAVPASVLYPLYRGVMTWALTPAAEHPGLFPPRAGGEARRLIAEAEVPPELAPALEALCGMLEDPAGADPGRVSEACARIGEWAERRGDAPATALRFLQAAGTCSPNDARVAYRAGVAARARASWDVAELWFRHASAVSRRKRDWEAHATAYLGLGNSYYRQGRLLASQREHLKALRVSKRHGIRELQGAAYHNLFTVALDQSNVGRAEEYARAAFNAYGPQHRTIPSLAHDIAYFWNTQGQFARSFFVFRALVPHFPSPEQRIRVFANLGRAAGGIHNPRAFQEAWGEVWMTAPTVERTTALTTSLLELSYGARSLGEWDQAISAASTALERAQARREVDVVYLAEEVLSSVRREREETAGDLRAARSTTTTQQLDDFTSKLVSSLEAMASCT